MHFFNTKRTNKRILIIDGKSCVRSIYKIGLEGYGFTVDTIANPLEALDSFEPEKYDLVMLGVAMADMNGFELCKELQYKCDMGGGGGTATKFCFITNFDPYRDTLLQEYPELSHYPFIITRITIEELVKIISEYLELRIIPFNIPLSDWRIEEILNEEHTKSNYVTLSDKQKIE